MRKDNMYSIIAGIICAIIFFGLFYFVGYVETHYNRKASVINTNGALITVKDNEGNIWQLYSSSLTKGDEVIIELDTNCTFKVIEDDIIINYKKVNKK